jgi:hypothetical protein
VNLHWTDYLGIPGMGMVLWWYGYMAVRVKYEDDPLWWFAAMVPFAGPLWYSVRHWRKDPLMVAVGAVGMLLSAAFFYWQPPK